MMVSSAREFHGDAFAAGFALGSAMTQVAALDAKVSSSTCCKSHIRCTGASIRGRINTMIFASFKV